MARPSKYEMMIGSVVSMSFADVEVTGYKSRKPEGKKYYKREIEIDHVLWVSVQSFEKQSFSRRYFKVVKEKQPMKQMFELVLSTKRVEEPVEVVEPTDELHDLNSVYDLRQLKNTYKKLARKFHPDNLDTGDVEQFKLVKTIYDVRKLMIEEILEVFGYDDPNFAELVDMTEDLHKSMHKIVY